MMQTRKCPKCGMVQMPAPSCKACGTPLSMPTAPFVPPPPSRVQSPVPAPAPVAAARVKPSAWYYCLSLLPPILGCLFLFYSFAGGVSRSSSPDVFKDAFKFDPVAAPGKQDLTFAEPGTYVIFYEYHSQQIGPVYTFSTKDISALNMTLKSKATGADITLTRPNMTYTYNIGNRHGTSLKEFTLNQAGIYEFSSWYPEGKEDSPVTLSVGRGFRGFGGAEKKFFGAAIKVMAIFFGSGAAGLGVAFVIFFLRKRAQKQAEGY